MRDSWMSKTQAVWSSGWRTESLNFSDTLALSFITQHLAVEVTSSWGQRKFQSIATVIWRCAAAYATCRWWPRKHRVGWSGFWRGRYFKFWPRASYRSWQKVVPWPDWFEVLPLPKSQELFFIYNLFFPGLGFVFCQREVKLLFLARDCPPLALWMCLAGEGSCIRFLCLRIQYRTVFLWVKFSL